jgi:hypothetical protein
VPQLLALLDGEVGLEADQRLYGTLMSTLRKTAQPHRAMLLLSRVRALHAVTPGDCFGSALSVARAPLSHQGIASAQPSP